MGDPKKQRKKYDTPSHPWEKERIDTEKTLTKTYGLANKKEIWRVNSLLSSFKAQAKKCAAGTTEQLQKERAQLLQRLQKLGLLTKESPLEDVLGFNTEDLLKRRLQTLVFEKKLASSISQSRQFIVHGHITVDAKKVTVPSYLVKKEEENKIGVLINGQKNG